MEMKQYLVETFKFNDFGNRKILEKIRELQDKEQAVKFLSHLVNSQNKWMARILKEPGVLQMSWWEPVYPLEELESAWNKSFTMWIEFLTGKTEDQMFETIRFIGMDGGNWEAQLKDIALQLNYHSIHHRAQIQTMIRQQGLVPDFIDYIRTVYRKID